MRTRRWWFTMTVPLPAPPRPRVDVAELEKLATDPPGKVCHLADENGDVLCGAMPVHVMPLELAEPRADASPCVGGCGRNRCAPCAAEYTMRASSS
jgi:hypothetical protein